MAEPAERSSIRDGARDSSRRDLYRTIHSSDDFQSLRRRYRRFAFPATAAFLAWYLLYVLLSTWAAEFMSLRVIGNINVAIVLGLLQFVSTFLIAWLYSRYADNQLDPLASRLEQRFDEEAAR